MIIRSIIFYNLFYKEKAIELAKLLHGYVDVECIDQKYEHIDIKQFHNVIFFEDDLLKIESIIDKFEMGKLKLKKYILSTACMEKEHFKNIEILLETINKNNYKND